MTNRSDTCALYQDLHRRPGYEVIDEEGVSHGLYDTLDEARGCVAFDRLTGWTIYGPDGFVEGEESQLSGREGAQR